MTARIPTPSIKPRKPLHILYAVLGFMLYLFVESVISLSMAFAAAFADSAIHQRANFYESYNAGLELTLAHQSLLLIFFALALIAILSGIYRAQGKRLFASLSERKIAFWKLPVYFAIGLGLNYLISWAVSVIPWPDALIEQYTESSSVLTNEGIVTRAIGIAIMTPVLEETIFRGLVYGNLKQAMPKVIAGLIEAALFGFMHGTPIWMAYGFVIGVVFTVAYEKEGSIWASVALHMGFNALGVILS